MNRNESRVIIIQKVLDGDLDMFINDNLKIDNLFVKDMVNGVLENKEKLYEIANKNLKDWNMSRLGLTDQAILCLGLYELLYTDTPDIVAINEAVELAKKYSTEDSSAFVNGLLAKIIFENGIK